MAKKKDNSAPKKTVTKKVVKKAAPAKKVAEKKKKVATKKAANKATPSKTVAKKKPIAKKDAAQLLADAIVHGILEVKGRNISILNLKSIQNRVCDYFIICQADSNTQVNAIAGSLSFHAR